MKRRRMESGKRNGRRQDDVTVQDKRTPMACRWTAANETNELMAKAREIMSCDGTEHRWRATCGDAPANVRTRCERMKN